MSNAQVLTWTVESDDKEEKNYALFVSGGASTGAPKKVQVSGWMDSPQAVVQGLCDGLAMGAPSYEVPE